MAQKRAVKMESKHFL